MCMDRRPVYRGSSQSIVPDDVSCPLRPHAFHSPKLLQVSLDMSSKCSRMIDLVITDRNDGTECASCCGAFRTSWFPSLFSIVSQTWSSSASGAFGGVASGGVERTHFACLSKGSKVSCETSEIISTR